LTGDDERYERLEHQAMFLFERDLVSREMDDWNRQLWLLERLVGRDPGKLDPHLRDRLHLELEKTTLTQLRETGLYDEWRESWDAREIGDSNSSQKPLSVARPSYIRL
jgi:hypothetical protein